ncbi:unnamed protein product [Bemisia tabaci]|uniref:Rab-like protein 5 n=1 Tax=Bemisia tabaci TaxID=7038 RepID=A0A9P0EVM2_BEMTA|nr:PREDICTED: intraflagellar transport protein 22 homolog [Bemisia tabaci]CAH0380982.1 unnamed protein product [Bemisia tabaci]
MVHKLKIVLVGPCKAGKSTVANFLSSNSENSFPEYRPTKGVRILEFEKKDVVGSGTIEIELWDTSGDHGYAVCWPAIQYRAHGVILMFDPKIDNHKSELLFFYQAFVAQLNLSPRQCLIITQNQTVNLPNILGKICQINGNIEKNGDQLKSEFFKFIDEIIRFATISEE